MFGGEHRIRTYGGLPLNGFQDRRIRPLCQLSKTLCYIFNYYRRDSNSLCRSYAAVPTALLRASCPSGQPLAVQFCSRQNCRPLCDAHGGANVAGGRTPIATSSPDKTRFLVSRSEVRGPRSEVLEPRHSPLSGREPGSHTLEYSPLKPYVS